MSTNSNIEWITPDALLERANRKLKAAGEMLCKSRGETEKADLGEIYLRNEWDFTLLKDVDLESFARQLDVLKEDESIADTSGHPSHGGIVSTPRPRVRLRLLSDGTWFADALSVISGLLSGGERNYLDVPAQLAMALAATMGLSVYQVMFLNWSDVRPQDGFIRPPSSQRHMQARAGQLALTSTVRTLLELRCPVGERRPRRVRVFTELDVIRAGKWHEYWPSVMTHPPPSNGFRDLNEFHDLLLGQLGVSSADRHLVQTGTRGISGPDWPTLTRVAARIPNLARPPTAQWPACLRANRRSRSR